MKPDTVNVHHLFDRHRRYCVPIYQRHYVWSEQGQWANLWDDLRAKGGFPYPESQTPWQEIFRAMTDQLAEGMTLKPAVKFQRVAQKYTPRDNH